MDASSKDYFERIGAGWDAMREQFFSPAVRDQALAAAGVRRGATAADIGAGTGFVTEALLERGVAVIAVDQSPAMLDALRAKFPPPRAVDCRVGEAESLPIDDATVDHAFANMYLHHVESPPGAIREMARILRPGGTLVITDLDIHDHTFLRTEHHDRWMGFERDDIERWYRAAGLEAVRVAGIGEYCCATSQRGERAAVGIFVASGTRPTA